MTLAELHAALPFLSLVTADTPSAVISGCYTGDLLSDVLAHAEPGSILVTVQAHVNTIAVAKEKGSPAIIFCNGRQPDPDVVLLAEKYGIALYATEKTQFTVSAAIARILFRY